MHQAVLDLIVVAVPIAYGVVSIFFFLGTVVRCAFRCGASGVGYGGSGVGCFCRGKMIPVPHFGMVVGIFVCWASGFVRM